MLTRYRLTKHAAEKMVQLGITKEQIEQTLMRPEEHVYHESALYFYQRLYERPDGRRYLLRVLVDEAQQPPSVVTIYVASRYQRYRKTL
jgi:hypothetical protein